MSQHLHTSLNTEIVSKNQPELTSTSSVTSQLSILHGASALIFITEIIILFYHKNYYLFYLICFLIFTDEAWHGETLFFVFPFSFCSLVLVFSLTFIF